MSNSDKNALEVELKQMQQELDLLQNAKPVDEVAEIISSELQEKKIDPFNDPNNEWIGTSKHGCCIIL